MRVRFLYLSLVVLGVATLLGGTLGANLSAQSEPIPKAGMSEYIDLLNVVSEWSAEAIEPEKLVYASIHGMLSRLDPHTTFLEPDDFATMQERQRGSFYGLGIQIQKRNGRITVISPIEGTPAWRLGIRAGDIIAKIEGEPTDDMTTDEAARRLKGPKGTKVHITIQRPGLEEPIEMTVTRAEIPTSSVRYAMMLAPETGYIRISDFTRTTDREVAAAIERLEKDGMKRLLLDLRDNPGGVLEQAVDVADILIEKGAKVVYTRGRTATSDQEYFAPGRGPHFSGPLVVLVNRGSASASEIVSGAVQDHDRGLVVGTTTWGKGLVQSVYTLNYGAGLALTTAKYYTPSGRWIQRDFTNLYEYVNPNDEEDKLGRAPESRERGKVFFTDAGRPVSAAGGIAPDVVVRYEKPSKYRSLLAARLIFFDLAVRYVVAHPDITRDFKVTPAVRDEFFAFVESRGLMDTRAAKDAYDKDSDRDAIDLFIRYEILNAKFGLIDGWRVWLSGDKQVQTALQSFDEATRIAALPKKKPIEKKAANQ